MLLDGWRPPSFPIPREIRSVKSLEFLEVSQPHAQGSRSSDGMRVSAAITVRLLQSATATQGLGAGHASIEQGRLQLGSGPGLSVVTPDDT